MPTCPHCEADISEWADTLQKAPKTNVPQVWSCPECDVILGISAS